MEMMTRRSFLKITGAMALAVGAAGALSGCDLVGDAMNRMYEQVGAQMGHAAATMGNNVWVGLSNKSVYQSGGDGLILVGVEFQVKNKRDAELTFKASDISNVKIDGHKAKVVVAPDDKLVAKYPAVFDPKTGAKTYKANSGMDEAENGYLFFAPDYAEGEAHLGNRWNNLEFTFVMNGKTATFTATLSDNKMTSAKK